MKRYRKNDVPSMAIKELPAEQRPREKLEHFGSCALSDLELLTILIGSGTVHAPASMLAHRVLELLDTKNAQDELTIGDLVQIQGIGMAKASLILAALELGRRRLPPRRKQIVFPSDAYPLIRHYGSRPQEHFLCISLNGAHEVMSVTVVSIGLVNHTLVHPRDDFA